MQTMVLVLVPPLVPQRVLSEVWQVAGEEPVETVANAPPICADASYDECAKMSQPGLAQAHENANRHWGGARSMGRSVAEIAQLRHANVACCSASISSDVKRKESAPAF